MSLIDIPPAVWDFLLTVLLSGTAALVVTFLVTRWFPSKQNAATGGFLGLPTAVFYLFIMALSPLPGTIAVGLGHDAAIAAWATIAVQLLVSVAAIPRLR